jgi:hypothetical protein
MAEDTPISGSPTNNRCQIASPTARQRHRQPVHGQAATANTPRAPLPPRPGEDLNAQQQRLNDLRAKQRELDRPEARLRREAQFSRKVALNRQVRAQRDAVARPGAG